MKRRNFLIGAGGSALGGSVLLGSGAFTSVEAQRNINIEVADDPDAYLGLDKCPDSPNSSYVTFDGTANTMKIDMSDSNPTVDDEGNELGEGVNPHAITTFHNVFQICNNGKMPACVWIEDDEKWPTYGDGKRRVEFYLEDDRDASLIGNEVLMEVGDCVCVGMRVDTRGLGEGASLFEGMGHQITINADTDGDCTTLVPDQDQYDIHLAYQDQEAPGGDYDYNDWLVDINSTFYKASSLNNSNGDVEELLGIDLEFVPLAKSAGLEHEFHLIDNNGIISGDCSGDYVLRWYNEVGQQIDSDSGSFDGTGDPITIFDSTEDVFDEDDAFEPGKWNAGPNQTECKAPIRTAKLELTFDEPCEFDFDAFDPVGDPEAPHGQDLFFNPKLSWTGSGGGEVERGDLELLTVPDGWVWPVEDKPIWTVYDEIYEDDGEPDFPSSEWRPPLVPFAGNEDLLFDACGSLE